VKRTNFFLAPPSKRNLTLAKGATAPFKSGAILSELDSLSRKNFARLSVTSFLTVC
jgi:hypothetical protein